MLDHTDLLKTAILDQLPKIHGVTWYADLSRAYGRHSLKVSIAAVFVVDDKHTGDAITEIKNRIHQITSDGQIPLELERYDGN